MCRQRSYEPSKHCDRHLQWIGLGRTLLDLQTAHPLRDLVMFFRADEENMKALDLGDESESLFVPVSVYELLSVDVM